VGLSWVACEARTGRVILDLPDLFVERVGAVLCTYRTAAASLPVATAPENWQRATLPKASRLVLLDDEAPIWGADIVRRSRSAGDVVELSLATPEQTILGAHYVGDVTYTGTAQGALVADLVDRFVFDGSVPMRVEIVGTDTVTRDHTYTATQHKTVLAAITELAGRSNGPEFTVGWERDEDAGVVRYRPVLYVGNRIGSPVPADMGPAATFELPGPVSSVEFVEDFGEGKGANSVTAYSSGSGEAVPAATATATDPDRPTIEYHWSPSTSITETGTLASHAARAVAAMAAGARSLSLTAVQSEAPRLGVDWWIGDDVGYGVTAPAFPDGLAGTARALGWELAFPRPGQSGPVMVTPVLASDEWEA
jgi:hypothetical protein